MYKVEVRIPDLVLAELTSDQWKGLMIGPWQNTGHFAELLGFHSPQSVVVWRDERECSFVYLIQTDEVIKPSLFGYALAYTAEAL